MGWFEGGFIRSRLVLLHCDGVVSGSRGLREVFWGRGWFGASSGLIGGYRCVDIGGCWEVVAVGSLAVMAMVAVVSLLVMAVITVVYLALMAVVVVVVII